MDRNDGLCFRSDGCFNEGWIDIVGFFININKYRCGSAETDCFGSGNKGTWGGDNFITLADTQAKECHPERVCAVSGPYGVVALTKQGEFFLKFFHHGAAGKGRVVEHFLQSGGDFFPDGRILGFQVQEWYVHYSYSPVKF